MDLPKEKRGLYTENSKTVMKEIKDDIKRFSMGKKNQYCENGYATKCNLQI